MARYKQAAAAAVVSFGASMVACGFVGVGQLSDAADGATTSSGGPDGSGADGSGVDSDVIVDGSSPPDDARIEATTDADAAPPLAASCTDLPTAANSDVTLYVGRDPAKPWSAHCGAAGETYLPLPAGAANNFSSYPDTGCAAISTGASSPVKTTWTRVRIDPATLVVTTNDYAGATSTGSTHEVSGNGTVDLTYVKMPFAAGRICDDQSPEKTVAKVDLTGTSFHIAANQFITEGFEASGSAITNAQATTITVTAFPGGMHPCQPAGTDYYQRNGGKCLQLVYGP